MFPGIGGEQFGRQEPAGLRLPFCGVSSSSPQEAILTHHVNIAKLGCTGGQEGPDPVDEEEDMEVKVGHLAATFLDPVVPVPVQC